MHGEDEPKAKEEDFPKMNSPSASQIQSGSDPSVFDDDHALAPHIQEQIGRRLSAVYDEILRQPIPDRFRLLLDQLDESSKAKNDRKSARETEIE